jgi:hypothetical protein
VFTRAVHQQPPAQLGCPKKGDDQGDETNLACGGRVLEVNRYEPEEQADRTDSTQYVRRQTRISARHDRGRRPATVQEQLIDRQDGRRGDDQQPEPTLEPIQASVIGGRRVCSLELTGQRHC